MTGPLCKVCGKPVPKKTTYKTWAQRDPDRPRTRAEAKAKSNHQLVSATLWKFADEENFICAATYWDGESYVWGGHFHAQSCAAEFGKAMAELFPGYSMPAYKAAMAEQSAVKRPDLQVV